MSARFLPLLLAAATLAANGAPALQSQAGVRICTDPASPLCQGMTRTRNVEPTFDSATLGEKSGVVIEAGEEKQVGKLRLTHARGYNRFALTASSPIATGESAADFVGLDGLADSLNLEGSYGRILGPTHWTPASRAEAFEVWKKHRLLCREVLSILAPYWSEIAADSAIGKALTGLAATGVPDEATLMRYLSLSFEEYENLPPTEQAPLRPASAVASSCSIEIMEEAYRHGLNEQFLEFRKLTLLDHPIPTFSLQGASARKTFKFLAEQDLAATEVTRSGYSYGASFGLVFPRVLNPDGVLLLTAKRERSYKDAGKVQVCKPKTSPVGGVDLAECETQPLGPPAGALADVLALEYRHYFSKGRYAVVPRLFYRDKTGEDSVTGVELPVYFLHNAASGLTGGIRLGWTDKDDELAASVFVGKVLELFQ